MPSHAWPASDVELLSLNICMLVDRRMSKQSQEKGLQATQLGLGSWGRLDFPGSWGLGQHRLPFESSLE